MDLVRDDRVELVQIGHVDLDPGLLTVEGTTLRDAIGAGRVFDDHLAEAGTDFPQTGWRLIHRSPPQRDWEGSEVFAAPTGDPADGGWAMATLSASTGGGGWILSADPRPMTVYPGRAARRTGLTLSWPDGLTVAAGVAPDLSIELRNQTDEVWVYRPGDGPFVRGWVLDGDGRRCEESHWFADGGGDVLPDLQPGRDRGAAGGDGVLRLRPPRPRDVPARRRPRRPRPPIRSRLRHPALMSIQFRLRCRPCRRRELGYRRSPHVQHDGDRPAEAVVVDGVGMPVVENATGIGVGSGRPPQLLVARERVHVGHTHLCPARQTGSRMSTGRCAPR